MWGFPLSFCCVVCHCVNVPVFLIHSPTDGHYGYFQHLAIVNSAAMNTGVRKLFWLDVSGILRICYQQWNCWVIRQLHFPIFVEIPYCFPLRPSSQLWHTLILVQVIKMTFSLCPHMASSLCMCKQRGEKDLCCLFLFLEGHQACHIRSPCFWPHLTLINFLKTLSLNIVMLGDGASACKFGWGDTIQSTTPST